MEFEDGRSIEHPSIKTEYSITALLGNLDDISTIYMTYNHPFLVGQPPLPEPDIKPQGEEVVFQKFLGCFNMGEASVQTEIDKDEYLADEATASLISIDNSRSKIPVTSVKSWIS